MHRTSRSRLVSLLLLTSLAACTGTASVVDAGSSRDAGHATGDAWSGSDAGPRPDGGGPATPDTGPSMPSPLVRIVFPIASNTTADRIHARVRVTGVDGVTSVTVNGVVATAAGSDQIAQVPLSMGDNTIAARVERSGGTALTASVVVRRVASDAELSRGATAWADQRAFGLLASTDETSVYFGDDIFDGAVRIDVATGNHEWIACTEATTRCDMLGGTGVDIMQPLDVRFSPDGSGLLISDGDQLVGADFATHGTRTISGRGTGTGPTMGRLASTIWDPHRSLVVGLDWDTSTILTITLGSGNRTLLSGASLGSGPEIRAAERLAYDGARDRAVFFQQYVSALYAVDLATGNRSIVSDHGVGTGPEVGDPAAIAVLGDTAYTWDDVGHSVFAIDLANGNRRIVAASDRGLGPLPTSCTLAAGCELVFARDDDTLYALDPVSGDRVVVSR